MERFFVNNVETVVKSINSSNSVTLSIFIDAGLPKELTDQTGISHFLEHMCFRGTKTRSLGGIINAYTTKEFTCYYITVLPDFIEKAMAILTDIVFHSTHAEDSITLEKSIINEEINMYEDTPDDKIIDLLSEKLFQNSYLGKPILGTADSISTFSSEILHRYYSHYFYSKNIKFVIAGAVPSTDILKASISYYLDAVPFKTAESNSISSGLIQLNSVDFHHEKDLEQMHFCYGFPGVSYSDENRYPLMFLTTLMGGSMSSRLFQSVRERSGLAYSIYCSSNSYHTTGGVVIYAGTSIEQYKQALDCIEQEIDLLAKGISDEEFDRTVCQLKGNIMIHLESSSAWANWLGRQLMYQTGLSSMDDLQNKLAQITKADVEELIPIIFNKNACVRVSLGNPSN